MAQALVLRSVKLDKAPGFERGTFPPIGGLEPGLNVIWGANGAGKSTLANALRELLWAGGEARGEAWAEARVGEASWRLEREGRTLRHIRLEDNWAGEGQWGGPDEADRHCFPLHLLLQERREDGRFKDFIKNEMQGGLDLEAAWAAAGAMDKPLSPKAKVNTEWEEAHRTYLRIKQSQDAQKGLRDLLEASREKLTQARQAGSDLEALRRVKALKTALDGLTRAQGDLADLPAHLARIMADDPRRVEDLERRVAALGEEVAGLRRTLVDLERALEALRVPGTLLRDGALKARLQAASERLSGLQRTVAAARTVLAAAEAAEAAWGQAFRWLAPDPPRPASLQAMVLTLQNLARTCEPLRCALEAARRHAAALGPREPVLAADTPQHWSDVQACLGAWQRATLQVAAPVGDRARRLGRGAAVGALIALAMVMTVFETGRLRAEGAVLLLAFLVAAATGLALATLRGRTAAAGAAPDPAQGAGTAAAQHRARIQELLRDEPGLLPRSWTPQALLEVQGEVAARLGQALLRDRRDQDRLRAAQALEEAQTAYAAWLETWAAAASSLGLQPGAPALESAPFFHFGGHLAHWLELMTKASEARGALDAAEAELAGAREDLRTTLGLAPGTAVEALLARTQDVLERRERAVQLRDQGEQVRAQLTRKAQGDLQEAQAALAAFWTSRGLPGPDRPGLEVLASQVETFLQRKAALEHREAEVAAALEAYPEGLVRARDQDWTTLDAEERDLQARAEALEACARETTALQVRYDTLLAGDDLAQAGRDLRVCGQLRDQALRDHTQGRVVALLLNELKEKALLEEQPPVLARASAWLQRFTGSQCLLGMNPDTGFFVRDARNNRITGLEQLSSGTRVQLLFAVRLAFIELEEGQGVNLPIFLDEVLGNADDERAAAMVEAVLEIARERQVFYFTAQADEVDKWRRAAGPGGLNEVPLDALGRAEARRRQPLLPVAPGLPVPPLLEDYAAYGAACEVAGPALFEPVAGLHAWHLFTRSLDLHQALRRRLRCLGQVVAAADPAEPAWPRRVQLLRHAQRLAQRGRGRPFLPADLRAPLCPVTNREAAYWAPLVALAQAAQGDGDAFWAALDEVRIRLKAELKQDLRAWLVAEGFISLEPALDAEAILAQLYRDTAWLEAGSEDAEVAERYVRAVVPASSLQMRDSKSMNLSGLPDQ